MLKKCVTLLGFRTFVSFYQINILHKNACLIFLDLQIDLVKFYSDSASTLPISPLRTDLDEKLDEVYVQPKLTIVQVGKTVSLENALKGKEVLTYSDVFDIGHSKNIYPREPRDG